MKPKKHRQMMRKFWKLEYNTFLQSMGELNLEKKARVSLKLRFHLCLAILKAPYLAKRGKLVAYIEKNWGKSKLEDQVWTEYTKVNGLIRFNCRTMREKPGKLVQIQIDETWWDEAKAIKLLGKELTPLYNEARIRE
jgi:hypothetical protein